MNYAPTITARPAPVPHCCRRGCWTPFGCANTTCTCHQKAATR